MDSHDHDETSDEPQTPMWLPALGVALFLAAGIWWATRPVPLPPPAPEPTPVASASASAAAPVAPSGAQSAALAPPRPNSPHGQLVPHRR